MLQTYFTDFRAYIEELEKRGKLYRWKRAINKDTELMPLMRLQYRGIQDDQRKAFLFENVIDNRGRQHAIRVVTGMYGSSRDIATLGLGCDEPSEIYEKWRHALAKPLEPRPVGKRQPVLAPVLRVLGLVPFQIHAADAASCGVKAA